MKILLAVDHTQQAKEAARRVPDCFPGAEVEILHVLDIEAVPHSHLSAALIDRYHQKIRARLQAEANRFLPNILELFLQVMGRVRVLVREGGTAEVILRTASSLHPDLIVLGSRGFTKVQAWLLGSVSYRVAQQARSPVLLIKHVLPARPKVLLMVDGSVASKRAVTLLAEQAVLSPCHVIVLVGGRPSPSRNASLRDVTARLSARGFTVDPRLLKGNPVTDILARAHAEAVDLIVTGTSDRYGWWRQWLWGNISRKIMMEAPTSVLLVRAEG